MSLSAYMVSATCTSQPACHVHLTACGCSVAAGAASCRKLSVAHHASPAVLLRAFVSTWLVVYAQKTRPMQHGTGLFLQIRGTTQFQFRSTCTRPASMPAVCIRLVIGSGNAHLSSPVSHVFSRKAPVLKFIERSSCAPPSLGHINSMLCILRDRSL